MGGGGPSWGLVGGSFTGILHGSGRGPCAVVLWGFFMGFFREALHWGPLRGSFRGPWKGVLPGAPWAPLGGPIRALAARSYSESFNGVHQGGLFKRSFLGDRWAV